MKRKNNQAEMRPEYDFSGGVRGKYYRRYMENSNVVVLDPDVHERFRNARAVNKALRSLIKAGVAPRGSARRSTRRRAAARR